MIKKISKNILEYDLSRIFFINKFTLSLKKKNEKNFQEKYFHDNIIQFRIAFLLLTINLTGTKTESDGAKVYSLS